MQRRLRFAVAALALAIALTSFAACSDDSADNLATEPTSTATPVQYTRVATPNAAISFEVPADWLREGGSLVWRPAENDPRRLSVRVVTPAPADLRSALPDGARIVSHSRRDLGWAAGTEYQLRSEAADSPTAEQTHVLVSMGTKALFDFAVSVPAGADQGPLRQALEHMLSSVVLSNPLHSPEAGATPTASGSAAPSTDAGFVDHLPDDA
jgi:hypothetical protein